MPNSYPANPLLPGLPFSLWRLAGSFTAALSLSQLFLRVLKLRLRVRQLCL